MIRTRIYIALSNSTLAESEKKYGYVLEFLTKEGPVTREGFGHIKATRYAATLTALAEALERLTKKCEFEIRSEDAFVNNMLNTNLKTWVEKAFRNGHGELIKNAEQWKRVADLLEGNKFVTRTGEHQYSDWMKREMEKMNV